MFFFLRQALEHPSHPQEQEPFLRFRIITATAAPTIAAIAAAIRISKRFMTANPNKAYQARPNAIHTSLTSMAAVHAIAHCQIIVPTAHLAPSSRRMAAIEAMHGV